MTQKGQWFNLWRFLCFTAALSISVGLYALVTHKSLPKWFNIALPIAAWSPLLYAFLFRTFWKSFRVYDSIDDQGRLFAFEVDNLLCSRTAIIEVVSTIPAAHITTKQLSEDQFCTWAIGNVTFAAEEPFGDNSRYWIGPISPTGWVPETEIVREAFLSASYRRSA